MNLPQYQCHKKVRAIAIDWIETNEDDPNLFGLHANVGSDGDEGTYIEVDAEYMDKHQPQEGGYYVEYEDGYKSYSPSAPFESGYKLIEHTGHKDSDIEAVIQSVAKDRNEWLRSDHVPFMYAAMKAYADSLH